MSLARHCDGPGCDTWQRSDTRLPDDWLAVADCTRCWHFCSWDCLIRYGATKEPVTEIPL